MKKLLILGSTGSIGVNTLNTVRNKGEDFKVIGLSANSNVDLLFDQITEFMPDFVVVGDEKYRQILLDKTRTCKKPPEILTGLSGLEQAALNREIDMLVNALVGSVGLLPTIAALKNGKTVALANKETLVMGGPLINEILKNNGGTIIPVDSEHSAIHQCLQNRPLCEVENILLTGSGGPFRNYSRSELSKVSLEQTLAHPVWDMGAKITVDSATLMNKGLEVLEAHFLFNLLYDKIRVLIHPQSIIHSMVQFIDGSIIAHMSIPDMRIPIQYALTYPDKMAMPLERLDLFK
ncbi:MAG: 1-deoxy-D-xylulose-5-phosphate reductoisomerase, partial [bacterium]